MKLLMVILLSYGLSSIAADPDAQFDEVIEHTTTTDSNTENPPTTSTVHLSGGAQALPAGTRLQYHPSLDPQKLLPRSNSRQAIRKFLEKQKGKYEFQVGDAGLSDELYIPVIVSGSPQKEGNPYSQCRSDSKDETCSGYVAYKDLKINMDGTFQVRNEVSFFKSSGVVHTYALKEPAKAVEIQALPPENVQALDASLATKGLDNKGATQTEAGVAGNPDCQSCKRISLNDSIQMNIGDILEKLDEMQKTPDTVEKYNSNLQKSCSGLKLEQVAKAVKQRSEKYKVPADMVMGMIARSSGFICNTSCSATKAKNNPLTCFTGTSQNLDAIYNRLNSVANHFFETKEHFGNRPRATKWSDLNKDDQDKFAMILAGYYSNKEYVSQLIKFETVLKTAKKIDMSENYTDVSDKVKRGNKVLILDKHAWSDMRRFAFMKDLREVDSDFEKAAQLSGGDDGIMRHNRSYIKSRISLVDSVIGFGGKKSFISVWSDYLK